MVEVEVLTARERVPGLLALDVGRERRVAASVGLDPRPLRRGDHGARLDLRVLERDPVAGAGAGEIGQLDPGGLLQRLEALHGEAPVGGPREPQDRLAGVLDALDRRPSVGDAATDRAVGGPQLVDLLVGDPVRPLDARAELLHQRPDRAPLLADARIVAIDDDQLRHRLAGNRLALAGSPVADLTERLGDLVGRVVQQRRGDHVAADAEMAFGQLREPLRDPRERVPVALVLPWRRHRLVEGVDERVQVGRREVVLLVPGRRRQDDVGEERVAGHPEVDRGQQVELALRRLLVPVHLLRAQLGRRLLRAHLRSRSCRAGA